MSYAPEPDPISLATVFIEPYFNDTDLEVSATGFVILTRTGPMLVTAGHVLTGRHPDGRCVHKQAALPNRITLTNYFGRLVESLPLYQGDGDPAVATPRFMRHGNPIVDVMVMPLPQSTAKHAANRLHESLWRPESYTGAFTLNVADPCYIIGYPEGLTNYVGPNRVLPLWKSGNLATDPQFDFTNPKIGFNAAPVCLIDATTRPGMSGAPVFATRSDRMLDRLNRLVGIYSGRTSDTSDLGLVWRPTVIHDILSANLHNW